MIEKYKVHIIYGAIIAALLAFNFLFNKPKEIVKTVTETKIVNKDVVKTNTKYIDRTIVKKDKDGDVTTITEHVTSNGSTTDKTKSQDIFTSKTTVSYLTRYSLDVIYPIPLSFSSFKPIIFDPKTLMIIGGHRLFNSPVFVTLGTNIGLDSVFVGVRVEF